MAKKPTGLHCPSCGHTTLQGLTRTEEAIVAKLASADEGLSAEEVQRGLPTDAGSLSVQISNLRKKLERIGWTIPRSKGGNGVKAVFRIEAIKETA